MRVPVILGAALAASVALAGCQTTYLDSTIRRTLPQICTAATAAHASFIVYSSAGAVSQEVIRNETIAWNSLQPICVDPEAQSAATILVAAAQAYATISLALDEAGE